MESTFVSGVPRQTFGILGRQLGKMVSVISTFVLQKKDYLNIDIMSKEKQTPPLVKIGIPKLSPYEISLLKELIPRASIKEIDGTIKIFIENFIVLYILWY